MSFFLAVDLDDPVRAQVSALIETHRLTVPAKWLRTDKLHVTLRFLGHPSVDALNLLRPEVEAIARATRPFALTLSGVGFFSTARAASVLWLGVGGELAALRDLHARLHPDDDRPYVPHVTLARAQQAGALETLEPALREVTSPPFVIDHVTLYESTDQHYRPLFRCGFAPAG